LTTYAWKASFTYGEAEGTAYNWRVLVSFSVNRGSFLPVQYRMYSPSSQ